MTRIYRITARWMTWQTMVYSAVDDVASVAHSSRVTMVYSAGDDVAGAAHSARVTMVYNAVDDVASDARWMTWQVMHTQFKDDEGVEKGRVGGMRPCLEVLPHGVQQARDVQQRPGHLAHLVPVSK